MKKTLLEISNDAMALNDLLDELQGDISGAGDAEVIDAWFTENTEAMDVKLSGYHALIIENGLRSESLKAQAKAMAELAKAHESRAASLKDRLKYFMHLWGKKKIETDNGEFAICASGGKQALDIKLPADDLPEQFRIISYSPNNDAIRAALEAGQALPFAELKPRGDYLRVR